MDAFEVAHVEMAVTSRVEPSARRAVAVSWNIDPLGAGLVTVTAVTAGDGVGVGEAGFESECPAQDASVNTATIVAAERHVRFMRAPVELPRGNQLPTGLLLSK